MAKRGIEPQGKDRESHDALLREQADDVLRAYRVPAQQQAFATRRRALVEDLQASLTASEKRHVLIVAGFAQPETLEALRETQIERKFRRWLSMCDYGPCLERLGSALERLHEAAEITVGRDEEQTTTRDAQSFPIGPKHFLCRHSVLLPLP